MTIDQLDARAALVVVDVQPFTLPNAAAVPAATLLDNVAKLLHAFRSTGRPVVFARSLGMPAGRNEFGEGGRRWPEELTGIVEEVRPREAEEVVSRAAWSAFAATDLDAHLRTAGIRDVVITGLATTFGVESTARSAYDLGYNVVVPSDAVSGPDARAHENALTQVFPLLGRVGPTTDVLRLV